MADEIANRKLKKLPLISTIASEIEARNIPCTYANIEVRSNLLKRWDARAT